MTGTQSRKAIDNELMAQFRKGDEDAFTQLVNQHRDALVNYSYRITGDYERAVEITQEAFLRVFIHADRYKPEYAFSTWLYKIATNLSRNHLRRTRIIRFLPIYDTTSQKLVVEPVTETEENPDLVAEREERVRVLRSALRRLPVRYRVPITLREIEEKSYSEIADILGWKAGTVKSRINRGKKILKKEVSRLIRPEVFVGYEEHEPDDEL